MRNEVLLKNNFGMGYVKMHGFHGNALFNSQDLVVGLQIQSYIEFYLF